MENEKLKCPSCKAEVKFNLYEIISTETSVEIDGSNEDAETLDYLQTGYYWCPECSKYSRWEEFNDGDGQLKLVTTDEQIDMAIDFAQTYLLEMLKGDITKETRNKIAELLKKEILVSKI